MSNLKSISPDRYFASYHSDGSVVSLRGSLGPIDLVTFSKRRHFHRCAVHDEKVFKIFQSPLFLEKHDFLSSIHRAFKFLQQSENSDI